MRKVALFIFLSLVSLPGMAELLPCEKLKARVDAKFQEKGMQAYTLEIVPIKGTASTTGAASAVPSTAGRKGKEVGTCDGGTKRLIYTRGN